ncbi:MAG: hypothetical protein LBL87_05935 [Ruminococcus sp.]|jgi:hypothetical protein|nr:hypothetical protein [Ruminococcus sp.]
MTREYIKAEIDVLPENAFIAFEKMFSAFFEFVEKNESDHFWSEENQAYLAKSISEFENGKETLVYKTMEELEAYENR